jgi:hypothetical protein
MAMSFVSAIAVVSERSLWQSSETVLPAVVSGAIRLIVFWSG